jgi:hypothetical protein
VIDPLDFFSFTSFFPGYVFLKRKRFFYSKNCLFVDIEDLEYFSIITSFLHKLEKLGEKLS